MLICYTVRVLAAVVLLLGFVLVFVLVVLVSVVLVIVLVVAVVVVVLVIAAVVVVVACSSDKLQEVAIASEFVYDQLRGGKIGFA